MIKCLNFICLLTQRLSCSPQVVSSHKYPVKPSVADINENDNVLLSSECRDDLGIDEECVRTATHDLAQIVAQFEAKVREDIGLVIANNDGLTTETTSDVAFTLVTDGQLHLRQTLFPEALRKNISLPDCFYRFHDLRKEFAARHPDCVVVDGIRDMLKCKYLLERGH